MCDLKPRHLVNKEYWIRILIDEYIYLYILLYTYFHDLTAAWVSMEFGLEILSLEEGQKLLFAVINDITRANAFSSSNFVQKWMEIYTCYYNTQVFSRSRHLSLSVTRRLRASENACNSRGALPPLGSLSVLNFRLLFHLHNIKSKHQFSFR